jgi:hypothetical protein
LADNLRPAGGVSDGGTGIGASELVEAVDDDEDDDEARGSALAPDTVLTAGAGCGARADEPAAARALAGARRPSAQAIETVSRRIRRG